MPESKMQDDTDFSPIPAAQAFGGGFYALLGPAGTLGSRAEVEKELDLIAAAVRIFHLKPADLVMRECSAYSARLTEMEVLLHRIEGESRQWARIRTMQVHKYVEEIDRQWRTASRLIEVQRHDILLSGGQV